jgi:WD40 repeat protein
MVAWSAEGESRQALQLDNYYACSADVNVKQQSLFLCGVPREATTSHPSACIFYFQRSNAAAPWERVGVLPRPEMKIVTAVRCIGDGSRNTFVTGEQRLATSAVSGPQRKDSVCIYDASSGPFESLQPQSVYHEHDDIITCLAAHGSDPELFFSGSKDHTIKLWDK